ncbi:ABC transporter ATP-binding protein [Cellulomonas sp. ATA003]|uniref:ABC transporter ATP-binding protein n=1 Tax=Cellulomonas sp. ATA003 TaxID=3073064 RepID=UPI0028735FFF|nr:ABC transporter ATP-binding protein [Cellulomonas sp. ATA003]WNB86496.1 ABC transporter ATP-binding protein [Cellulomonas sp. ATA003]
MSRLQVEELTRHFPSPEGSTVVALDGTTLDIPSGSFTSIIGPSGCGKSTLFNLIAGLDHPTAGRVRLDGEDCTGHQGRVGYMLQKDLLLPWRTILGNVALGLEVAGVGRKEREPLARRFLSLYGLGGFEDRYPAQLSGGMRQRAALLRTILFNRDVILLDEPFGALDALTRAQMQEWLLDLWDDLGKTVVFVTHDVDEAVYLSDTVYVMSPRPGRVIAKLDVPLDRPRKPSVVTSAQFVELKRVALGLLGERQHEEVAA